MVDPYNYSYKLIDLELSKAFEEYKKRFFGNFYYRYQELAKKFNNILKVNIKDKKRNEKFNEIAKALDLNVTLSEVQSLSIGMFFITLVIFIILSFVFSSSLLFLIGIVLGVIVYIYLSQYPYILYNNLKNKKKGQLASALLFLSMKLRENPNLEQAVLYLAKYIDFPIKLDFLVLLRDTYNKKYSSIEEALDYYSRQWEESAYFFTIGIELLISALREPNPERRGILIDDSIKQALDVLLDSLSYLARELQQPINLISTFGIILPTLLLTVFPLASAFLSNIISMQSMFVIFDIVIPLFVYLNVRIFISEKYSSIFFEEDYLLKKKMNDKKLLKIITSIGVGVLSFIVLFFVIVFLTFKYLYSFAELSIVLAGIFILSLGLALSFGLYMYYSMNSKLYKDLTDINRRLSVFLLSLSNPLNKDTPLENSLFLIYPRFYNTTYGEIIRELYRRIRNGESFNEALFNEENGILNNYPSTYLHSAMEVIVEAANISPKNAAQTAGMIGRYFAYLDRVKERLKDLVAEAIAQLKSMGKIIAPSILGIITATSIMTVYILYKLGLFLNYIQMSFPSTSISSINLYLPLDILSIFTLQSSITPSSIFITVGLFNIFLVILITMIINTVEDEGNKLKLYKDLSRNLLLSTILYFVIATLSSIALYNLANVMVINIGGL